MIYCQKCGKKNVNNAKHCIECGAPISTIKRKEKREDTCFGEPEKRVEEEYKWVEEECLGITHGREIVGIVVGVFIILIGLSIALTLHIGRWIFAYLLFVIGLLIIFGVIFGRYRR